jgi:hypothetical protein
MRHRSLLVWTAFAALPAALSPLGAQFVPQPPRSASTAALLGAVIPGAGHFYAGEKARGAAFFLVTAENVGTMLYFNNRHGCPTPGLSPICDDDAATTERHAIVIASAIVGGAVWIVSAIDAPRAVRREEERQRTRSAVLDGRTWHVVIAPACDRTPTWRVGLRTTW